MDKLEFFTSMYLECVCDETREEFLSGWDHNLETSDRIQSFRGIIEKTPYNELIETFRVLMGAEMAIMFQTRFQENLSLDIAYRDITVLAHTHRDNVETISILRSELLEFYRNHDKSLSFTTECPFSTLLLDIKDSVRVVQVSEEQRDQAVQTYLREPCTIAYVQLDHVDQLNDGKIGHVFFAFFFHKIQRNQLMTILKPLQGFLSFRHSIKLRIEKDFSGNLFGKRAEETWRTAWLSNEKAGSHTDSSGINRLISKQRYKDNESIIEILFGNKQGNADDSCQLLKLIYNVAIAMYYRAVISEGDKLFISADNIIEENGKEPPYFKVGHLINFSNENISRIKINFGKGQSANDINNARLYGAWSTIANENGKKTGSIPVRKRITFRQRYLRAFLVDILCNIETYGVPEENADIYIEDRKNAPGYLVFQNKVMIEDGDPIRLCKAKNYKLKQAIEFGHIDTTIPIPKGISLGCIAHCMAWAGGMIVCYVNEGENTYFRIKLPIIEAKEGGI